MYHAISYFIVSLWSLSAGLQLRKMPRLLLLVCDNVDGYFCLHLYFFFFPKVKDFFLNTLELKTWIFPYLFCEAFQKRSQLNASRLIITFVSMPGLKKTTHLLYVDVIKEASKHMAYCEGLAMNRTMWTDMVTKKGSESEKALASALEEKAWKTKQKWMVPLPPKRMPTYPTLCVNGHVCTVTWKSTLPVVQFVYKS